MGRGGPMVKQLLGGEKSNHQGLATVPGIFCLAAPYPCLIQGDYHIWTVSAALIPLASCWLGYSSPGQRMGTEWNLGLISLIPSLPAGSPPCVSPLLSPLSTPAPSSPGVTALAVSSRVLHSASAPQSCHPFIYLLFGGTGVWT
jgi:hypothetical protein